jgi:tRNA(adenine34) deaminase
VYGRKTDSDEEAMLLALQLAEEAGEQGEVPVGAVVVHNGIVVGLGRNKPITSLDPSAHAEMVAIRDAASRLGNYRLGGCTLYVTLEPCTMCTGLLFHSRIERLVYGAAEPKAGAIASALQLPLSGVFNHSFLIDSGVLADRCGQVLSDFFAHRRQARRRLRQQVKATDSESGNVVKDGDKKSDQAV